MKVAASKSLGCAQGGEASWPKVGQAKPGLRRYHGLCPWGAKSVLFLMIWAVSLPLFAQNAVTITNYLGDQSTGSFAGSVTALNAQGAGNLVFQISALNNQVTLSGPLSVFSQSTSFVGATGTSVPGINLNGQTSSESTLLFQNGFYLGPGMSLNLTDQGAGLSAGITAAFIYMDSNSGSSTKAGDGGFLSTSGASNLTGNTGGQVFWTASAVTMNSILGGNLQAGAGGAVTDVGGTGDSGGAGGAAVFQTGAWSLSDSNYSITGGLGGSVSDASGSKGGAGGGVSLSVGSLSDTNSSGVFMTGGNGQAGSTGGAGGAATVLSGLMTVAGSNWILKGGNGGAGTISGGAGGAVSVSWSALNETQGAVINVSGGNGASGGNTGGAGGNLSASGVSILESGSASNLNLNGGTGGSGSSGVGGNGGSAAITMVSVQLTNSTGMALLGGNGGSSTSAVGGNGGNALVSIGAIDIESSSGLSLVAGSGGSGAGGGNGGDAQVLAGAVTLNTGGNLSLKGGDAGNPGGLAGGVGVGFQNTFIGSGSTLNLVTGSSNGGPAGSVVASLASLAGTGDIVISGQGSVLQVGTGSFGGVISGTESLVQTSSSGALTLSGANVYSGGTTVTGGLLAVDTGGGLGSGGIFVEASKRLEYFDSATAGFSAVTADGSVSFVDQSSAGAATLTLDGTGSADFSGTAQGGTARFILNGGLLDISASGAGVVTVGSIEGLGTVSLGDIGLAAGSDNLSTTFTGSISDGGNGGFLIKQGTGILAISQGSTYQGGTLIQQGQLAVGDGGALGSGSVTVLGGTLSSMGSAVAVTVGGDYIQGTNGTLQLGLYGTAATGVDSVFVVGNTQLAGTLQLTQGAGYTSLPVGDAIVLMEDDNGINGTFQKVQESLTDTRLLPFYSPTLFQVVSINLSFEAYGNTANEKAVGADLDRVYLAPDLQALIYALGTQSDAVSIRTAYDQISPSGFSVIYQSAFEDASLQGSEIEDRLAQLRDTPALPAAPSVGRRASIDEDARFAGNLSVADEMAMIVHPKTLNDDGGGWGGFFSGDGGHFIVGNTLNAPGFKSTSYGIPAAGVDYQVSRQLALGVMVGYGESDIALNANGAITQTGAQIGFYGSWHPTKAYLDLLVSGGLNQYSSQRQTYDGFVGGKTQGYEINSRVTGGYDWKGRDWALGPSLAAQWTHVSLGSFTEKGPIDSLTMPDQSQDSIMSLAGFHAQGKIHIGGIAFEPQAKASWEHEFAYQGGTIQAGFGEGDNFEVAGPAVGQDGFLVRGGLDTILSPQFTISLGAQAELGRANLTSNQFDGGMKFGF